MNAQSKFEINLDPSHETGVIGNGGLRYNIQMAQDVAGVWHQRHIWHATERGNINPPMPEEWIVSGTGRSGPNPSMYALTEQVPA